VKASKIIDVMESLKEKESTKDIVIKLPKSSFLRNAARKAQLDRIKDYMYSIRSFN
jgi:hypothetical protein